MSARNDSAACECGGRGLVVVEREPRTVYTGECCGNVLPSGECCAAVYGLDRLVQVPHLEPVYEEVACPTCAPK